MNEPYIRFIPSNKAHALIKDQASLVTTFDFGSFSVCHLTDGRRILYRLDSARYFLLSKNFEARDDDLTTFEVSIPIWADRMDARKFVDKIATFIEQIPIITGLTAETCDFSRRTLRSMDIAIRTRFTPEARLADSVFLPLTAYVGEVIQKETNGRWEARYDQEFDIWEPLVVLSRGGAFNPYLHVYKEFYDKADESGSLFGAVAGDIGMPEHPFR